MTSVEGVSSNDNIYPEEHEQEVLKEETAIVSPEVKSSGEGMEMLRAEEQQLQAGVIARHERLERIKNTAQNIEFFTYMKGYLDVLEKIAAVDYSAAKAIVDSWKYDFQRNPAYLHLAKFAKDEELGALFKDIKEDRYGFSDLWKVYQEENRRGLPEAEQTFESLLLSSRWAGRSSYLSEDSFASVEFAHHFKLPNFEAFLANLLKGIDEHSYFSGYEFRKYLPLMEGWSKELLSHVLPAIKDKIRTCDVDDQIEMWAYLLKFEACHPELQDEFEEDVAEVIQLFKENPGEDCNYELRKLVKALAPIVPHHAERFLEFFNPEDPDDMIKAKVAIFIGKAKDPEFDRKGEFFKLKEEIEPHFELFESEGPLELFKAAYAAFGEEARPYFHDAVKAYRTVFPLAALVQGGKDLSKEIGQEWKSFWGIPQEDTEPNPLEGTIYYNLHRWDFKKLLNALTPTNLPDKEEAIKAAYCIDSGGFRYAAGEALLKAEVSLL